MANQKRIKILFLHHGIGIGGAPISLLNLVKALNKSQYRIKILFLQDGKAVELFKNEGFETRVLNAGTPYFSLAHTGRIQWYYLLFHIRVFWMWFKTAYEIGPKILANEDFDILHLNSHVLSAWSLAASRLNKSVILHNREAISRGYFGLRKRFLQLVIRKTCAQTIHICNDNKARLGIIEDSIVVYNFVEIPKNYRTPFDSDTVKVLFLGGSASIKGFETVVDSLKGLHSNVRVLFAGNLDNFHHKGIKKVIKYFSQRNKFKHLQTLRRAENVDILGLIENPLEVIDECDILISPFAKGHFSRPAIEAFAYGKPVIVSDAKGGLDEIVDHGVNGLVFEKQNPIALANAINNMAQCREASILMGKNGREKALSTFSPKVNVNMVSDIYQKIYSKV